MNIQSVSELAVKVAKDPALEAAIKANPTEAIASIADDPLKTDRLIYRIIVVALGLTILISLIGIFIMAYNGKLIPESAVALGSAAVGALAGLLAPSPK